MIHRRGKKIPRAAESSFVSPALRPGVPVSPAQRLRGWGCPSTAPLLGRALPEPLASPGCCSCPGCWWHRGSPGGVVYLQQCRELWVWTGFLDHAPRTAVLRFGSGERDPPGLSPSASRQSFLFLPAGSASPQCAAGHAGSGHVGAFCLVTSPFVQRR